MYSVIMTGYMFKNAQYRLELQQSLEQVALPDVQDKKAIYSPLFSRGNKFCNIAAFEEEHENC